MPEAIVKPDLEKGAIRGVALSAFVVKSARWGFAVFLALLFFGAMFWAKGRDPFHRIWFHIKVPGYATADCVAVIPKTARTPQPVAIYSHGSGGSMLASGNELRRMAEMGVVAIDMDYNQTNEAAFSAQLTALLAHLQHQPWTDVRHIAWVGMSLGAQRQLALALKHPELQPDFLVRVSGGWISELEKFETGTPRLNLRCPVLLLHGSQDSIFPLDEARRVSAVLRTNGVAVHLEVFANQEHGLHPNRLQFFRAIGETLLARFRGPDALLQYQSILAWRQKAKPLWLFWLPAFAWLAWWLYCKRLMRSQERMADITAGEAMGAAARPPLSRWEIGLRWLAVILAAAAIAETALHLLPPRLRIGPRLLSLARKHLVQPKEQSDFSFLAAQAGWEGKRLGALLTQVELANYNRELINWKLDDNIYRDYVLAPQIDPALDGDLDWRRELWENFYPRIRHENSPIAAAVIIAEFLRERVTIASGTNLPITISEAWRRQITNERGFEGLYVAALRSGGVPARLNAQGKAELFDGSQWQAAPRPLVEIARWQPT
ncbi:MAG TPA: dienelactone hydrolase family protein [Verrucomicrobiae bacterium]|nr:dienelactone hydrolase family protein [Verrucomicrobiae bacterium]